MNAIIMQEYTYSFKYALIVVTDHRRVALFLTTIWPL